MLSSYPVDLVEAVHVELPHKTRKLAVKRGQKTRDQEENAADVVVLEV